MRRPSDFVCLPLLLSASFATGEIVPTSKSVFSGQKAVTEIQAFVDTRWHRQAWQIEFRPLDGGSAGAWYVKETMWWVQLEGPKHLMEGSLDLEKLDRSQTYEFIGVPVNKRPRMIVFYVESLPEKVGETKRESATETLWENNKLTSDQPFPAAVRAVKPSWVGYELLLEELGGERLCVARVWSTSPIAYTLIPDRAKELAAEPERKTLGWNYISPAIEVGRFSWSLGVCKIGRIFGEEDFLRRGTRSSPSPIAIPAGKP